MTLEERLRYARERAKMTQIDLAEITGMSRLTIGKYESGKTIPSDAKLEQIAEALSVSWGWLKTGAGTANDPPTVVDESRSGNARESAQAPSIRREMNATHQTATQIDKAALDEITNRASKLSVAGKETLLRCMDCLESAFREGYEKGFAKGLSDGFDEGSVFMLVHLQNAGVVAKTVPGTELQDAKAEPAELLTRISTILAKIRSADEEHADTDKDKDNKS